MCLTAVRRRSLRRPWKSIGRRQVFGLERLPDRLSFSCTDVAVVVTNFRSRYDPGVIFLNERRYKESVVQSVVPVEITGIGVTIPPYLCPGLRGQIKCGVRYR
jgi:hypothetical protein